MIYDQTAAFHVEDFHAGASAINEDEHFAILNVASHVIGDNTAEGIEAFAHVGRTGIKIIAESVMKMKHKQSIKLGNV